MYLRQLASAVGVLVLFPSFAIAENGGSRDDLFYDYRFYGSIRPVIQYASPIVGKDEVDLAQYSSRAGFAMFHELRNRTGLIFRGEAGFEETKLEFQDGERLLFGGLRGPWGQLTFGRQWSAFYSTVGEHMDKAIRLSGFGYLGTRRISDSLQYSRTFGPSYLQLDAIFRDVFDSSSESENGLNRWQMGLGYEGAIYRFGLAYDENDESEDNEFPLNPDQTSVCDNEGSCFGLFAGWRGDDAYANLGYTENSSDEMGVPDLESWSLSLGWNPNFWSYYMELSTLDDLRNSYSFGFSYQFDNQWHVFSEFVFHDNDRENIEEQGLTELLNDRVMAVGLRYEFRMNLHP